MTDVVDTQRGEATTPPARARGRRRRGATERMKALGYPTAALLAVLGAWELFVRVRDIPQFLLPTPSAVFEVMVSERTFLLLQSWETFKAILLGFVAAIAVGLPLALAIVASKLFTRTFYPLIVASQILPKVAIAPLLLLWLGFGLSAKVALIMLIAFFPIVIDGVIGLRSTPVEVLHVARSMGGSGWRIFWKIRFPGALPSIMGGVKLASTLAVIGAVVAEFVGAGQGLGRLLLQSIVNLQAPLMFAGIAYLTILGVALFMLVELLERVLVPWHVSKRLERLTEA